MVRQVFYHCATTTLGFETTSVNAEQVELIMEQRTLKTVNNHLNINLETSGGQSSNPYLNVDHFFQHQC